MKITASVPKIVALAALVVIGTLGFLSTLFTSTGDASQQAVQYARGCFWVVLPYCAARMIIYLLVHADKDAKAAGKSSFGRLWGADTEKEGDGE